MKKLDFTSPDLFLGEDVALVGSSANLLLKKSGPKIDNHNEIIRFNRAPTVGFEKFVGKKTTIRVANSHVILNVVPGDPWNKEDQPYQIDN